MTRSTNRRSDRARRRAVPLLREDQGVEQHRQREGLRRARPASARPTCTAYNIDIEHHDHADDRDRRRVRLHGARERPREVPHAVRPAGVHGRERLPQDRQPHGPDLAAAAEPARERRLDGRDRARRRHGERRVPEVQDPRRPGDRPRRHAPLGAGDREVARRDRDQQQLGRSRAGRHAGHRRRVELQPAGRRDLRVGRRQRLQRRRPGPGLPGHLGLRDRGRRHEPQEGRVEPARLDRDGVDDGRQRVQPVDPEAGVSGSLAVHVQGDDRHRGGRRSGDRPRGLQRGERRLDLRRRHERVVAVRRGDLRGDRQRRRDDRQVRQGQRREALRRALRHQRHLHRQDAAVQPAGAGWDGPTGYGTPNARAEHSRAPRRAGDGGESAAAGRTRDSTNPGNPGGTAPPGSTPPADVVGGCSAGGGTSGARASHPRARHVGGFAASAARRAHRNNCPAPRRRPSFPIGVPAKSCTPICISAGIRGIRRSSSRAAGRRTRG